MPADPRDVAHLLPEAARRQLCLDLLNAAGVDPRTIRIKDDTGEIVHGCLLTPGAHDDQVSNPTASLNYKKLAGNCLGCKAAGGFSWFIAVVLRTDDAGARRWLAEHGAAADGVMPLPLLLAAINGAFTAPPAPEPVPVYSPAALDAWRHRHPYWTDPPAPPGVPGGGRGVHPATVSRFRLGYDTATKRVVIPHFWHGKLVGWQSRAVTGGERGPKYLNTPSFPRHSTLFGYDPQASEMVWVESAMSVLRHAHVMPDFVSTFGAKVTDEQIGVMVSRAGRPLKRFLLWPDADPSGWDAIDGGASPERGLIARLSRHAPVFVVDSPFTDDPAVLEPEVAMAVRERFAVPAALWRRPQALACWSCRQMAHPGPCPAAGLAA